jgi:4-hydroxybenzoate polyprenyltransferase
MPSLRDYAQLVRLPNVFTAMADIFLGFLFTHTGFENWPVFILLLGSSSLMYMAGMVLNDVFDVEQDTRERPERPIPSGRVPLELASRLGWAMLLFGVLLGWLAGALNSQIVSGLVATALATAVVLYDRILKRTPLAPLVMGLCRFLNVVLGMSALGQEFHAVHLLVAAGIGVYIVGVTVFARTEAAESHRGQLLLGVLIMACGIALLAWFPSWADENLPRVSQPRIAANLGKNWYLFVGMLGMLICWRGAKAIFDPTPGNVQTAVKHSILSLIMLDAVACSAVRDVPTTITIVFLLAPAFILGHWLYST